MFAEVESEFVKMMSRASSEEIRTTLGELRAVLGSACSCTDAELLHKVMDGKVMDGKVMDGKAFHAFTDVQKLSGLTKAVVQHQRNVLASSIIMPILPTQHRKNK